MKRFRKSTRLLVLPIICAVLFAVWILQVFHGITLLQTEVNQQSGVIQQLNEVEKDIRDLRTAFLMPDDQKDTGHPDWGLLYAAYWKRTGSLDLRSVRRDFIDPHLSRADALISRAALDFSHRARLARGGEVDNHEYLQGLAEALSQIKGAQGVVRSQITDIYVELDSRWQQLKVLIWVSCLFALLSALLLNGYQRANEEKRRISSDLMASEARFKTLFDSAAIGIAVMDPSGTFDQSNPALQKLLGYDSDELKSMRIPDLTYPEDWQTLQEKLLEMRTETGSGFKVHQRFVRKDGSTFWSEVNLTATSFGKARTPFCFALIEDITSRKLYEEGLIDAKERAEEMTRVKRTFLANMHHEIRTPLSVILVGASLIKDQNVPGQADLIRDIQGSGKRLLDMLDSILQFANIEDRAISTQPEITDVAEQVGSVAASLRRLASDQGLTLSFDTVGTSSRALLDRKCLQRVVHELIENAVKFTEQGHISVVVEGAADQVRLSVEDSGRGISREFIPFVFDAFRQESTGDTRSHEGAGLGLAITKQLVEVMGGSISVKSEPGRGSRFDVTFPHVEDAPGGRSPQPPRSIARTHSGIRA